MSEKDQKEGRPNQKAASAGGHPRAGQRGVGWGKGCPPARREQDLLLVFLEVFAQVGHPSFLLSSLKRSSSVGPQGMEAPQSVSMLSSHCPPPLCVVFKKEFYIFTWLGKKGKEYFMTHKIM